MIICLAMACFFIAGSQAQAGGSWSSLKDWMAERWKAYNQDQDYIQKDIFSEQLHETDNSNYSLELEEFFKSTTTSSKSNIETHQQQYLQQLKQAKNQLNHNPIGNYEEKRREDIDKELTQELEQFLAELLGEN